MNKTRKRRTIKRKAKKVNSEENIILVGRNCTGAAVLAFVFIAAWLFLAFVVFIVMGCGCH